MSLLVKICGMTQAETVDAAMRCGADALGFVFAESPRRVTPQQAKLAANDISSHVLRVAVMRHPKPHEWREVLDVFRPDVLQTDAADFEYLDVPTHIRRWPVVREGDGVLALPQEFVYEGKKSGQGETVDWGVAAALARRGRMILAGGLDANNVAEAIRTVRPFGVDVSSAVESAPGRKDAKKIGQFINAVRAAQAGKVIHEI
ncbi:MAG: phosphoribosylanthranilate isomerase [Gammaproteobacteria bacterium]|nr:phosphoribosylanthranilate isomerase [Gammaproteobacteria bacterium]MDH4314466.1 phosphoribosylanthranilate isomerase [Gammaproteobacteria bacterium]MDH5213207.1 phosphoribosylanthranilate isomerase [Gammaproteobacteria bacterium]